MDNVEVNIAVIITTQLPYNIGQSHNNNNNNNININSNNTNYFCYCLI